MKSIILKHRHPLLENFESLNIPPPESYSGFIYLWYCTPDDMFYIGSHKGLRCDGYRGTGSRFKKVFEYHGITQFKRVIIEYVHDVKLLKVTEQKWINIFNAINSTDFYNVKNAVK